MQKKKKEKFPQMAIGKIQTIVIQVRRSCIKTIQVCMSTLGRVPYKDNKKMLYNFHIE